MTKRILAAFLAVMMVVGMIPATVLAAGTCAVSDKYDAHSKAHCDLEKVTYTKVVNGTVEAACGQDGYTLYKCECGVFFADDIVRAPQQHAATTATTAAVAPTCAEDGHVAIYTCTNEGCGKTFMKADEIAAAGADAEGVIAATGEHDYKTNGTEANCMDAESKCVVCGKVNPNWEAQDAHTYVYNDPEYYVVKKVPTESTKGEIWYYCTYSGCEHHKSVEIKALDHAHVMEKVAAKTTGEGCVTTTVAEHYKCTKCNKLYTDKDGANETTIEKLTTNTDHAWNADPVIIEPTCTTWGFSYYGCPVCGATKGVTPETENEDMTKYAPLGHISYQCKTHGRTWNKDCQECKDVQAYCAGYVKTEPGCETDGKHEWNCRRTWKNQAGETVTCDYTPAPVKIDKTNHKLSAKVVIPATHYLPYAIEFQYCTNANCNDKNGVATEKVTTWTYDDKGTAVVIDLLRYAKDGNVYDLPADDANISGYKVVASTVKVTKITKEANQVHYYKAHVYNEATCEGTGETLYYCPNCMLEGCNVMVQTPAKGHTYGTSTAAKKNDIAATCTTNAFKVCDRAGCDTGPNGGAYQLEQANTKGHTWDMSKPHVILPTCDGTEGYTYYDCKKCSEKLIDAESKTAYEWKAYYETYEEASAIHNLPATPYAVQQGSCLVYGYYKYLCGECGRNVAVLIDGTGEGHSEAPTDKVHAEATCTQWKGHEEYTCTKCGETVAKKVEQEALGHDMLTHDAVAPTCLAAGNTKYFECKRCEKFFADEEGATEIAKDSWIEKKLAHNFNANQTEEVDECETPGFIHYFCTNGCCDNEGKGEYVANYVDVVKHDEKGQKEHLDATCIKDGYDKFYCSICGELQRTAVITAKGHMNAAGQVITTKCTDTVRDRVCVQCNEGYCDDECNTDVVLNADDKWEVITLCTETEVYAPNSCEHYGYIGTTCVNGCGTKDVIIAVLEPTGHKAPWLVEDEEGNWDYQVIMKDEKVTVDENVIDELYYNLDEEAGESYVAPTYEALGSFTFKCCNECGRLITVDVIRTGLDFTVVMDNATVAGANTYTEDDEEYFAPVDGDVISVDIYANAYKTDVWGFNFDVNYSAYSLNFLGYKFHAQDTFANFKVNNLTSDETYYEDINNDGIMEQLGMAKDYNGQIKVSAYTANGADGKIKDATINGTVKVITLYFQVEAQVDYTEMGIAQTTFDHEIFVDMEEQNANGEWEFTGAVVNSKGDVEATGDWFYADATKMLDTNADEKITIADLYNCNQILTGESDVEYLAAADANKDGKITITDLDLMNQLLQGADEVVIYKALSWTAPEGFVAA